LSVEQYDSDICMKLITAILLFCVLTLFNLSPIFAQEPVPTPPSLPQVQWTNDFTVEDKPSVIITLLQDFIQGFDSFMGGFIFYTPDPFGETIKLKDGSEIPGISKYRDIFYQLAIPISAIAIAVIAIMRVGSDNAQELKSFGLRFLMTIILFITVPTVLSYTIQFNNLLVEKITTTQQFTGFLDEYLTKSEAEIRAGNESEQYGIPSYDISMTGGVFRSLGKFIVQTFLFILTFLFLLGGFVYIGFQFVIRFATLLFLGVLFPIILPFMLAERTQNIVNTFFKLWFTFLIQQPAFVLGFAIANDIFSSILTSQGPSVGMLFFYTGFLFFLGGVNMLVGRIFGDTWGMVATNMQAAIATRSITSPITSRLSDFKRGLVGGSMSYGAGHYLNEKWKKRNVTTDTDGNPPTNGSSEGGTSSSNNSYSQHTKRNTQQSPFTQVLTGKGLEVQAENQKQGIVSVTGEAYKYDDNKTGLTSIYPTRLEALQDGVPEQKLETINLEQDRFIDLSSFNKRNPNPHNYNAMQEAQKRGKGINYAYINQSSPSQKVKHFLEVSEKRNSAFGIKGVIVERQGSQTSDHIIRMYSYKDHEKRKNI